jgi:monoamine oxidase
MHGGWRVPVGGFESLAGAIQKRLDAQGRSPEIDRELVGLDLPLTADQPITLRFRSRRAQQSETVFAHRVVLAMPRRAIERIPEFPARDQFKDWLATVEPWAFGKALLLYPQCWWTALGIRCGFSVTDRPMRQIWHFGAERGRDASERTDGRGVVMAFFDGADVAGWRALAKDGHACGDGLSLYGSGHVLTRTLHAEVERLYASRRRGALPLPRACAFQDWSVDPFGGAVHVWARGADSERAASAMLRPIPQANLFVCGEAWSHQQGWVEGALATADAMLHAHFQIEPQLGRQEA